MNLDCGLHLPPGWNPILNLSEPLSSPPSSPLTHSYSLPFLFLHLPNYFVTHFLYDVTIHMYSLFLTHFSLYS